MLLPLVFGLALFAFAGSTPALAQNPLVPHVSAPAASAAEPAAAHATHDSPRALIQSFLREMRTPSQEALRRAAAAFDLDDALPGERVLIGQKLARELLHVLNRIERIDPTTFPAASDPQLASGTWTWSRIAPGPDPIPVEIEFARSQAGHWRVSRDTAARLHGLYLQVLRLPVLDGLSGARTPVDYVRQHLVPAKLQRVGFLLEHWQWLGLLVLLALGATCDLLVRGLAGRIVRRAAGDRGEHGDHGGLLDREQLQRFERPVGMYAGALVAKLLLPLLDLAPGYLAALVIAANFVLTVAGVWAAYRLVDLVCGYLGRKAQRTDNKFDDMLVPLLRRTLKIFVLVVGLIYIASQWSDKLWSVIAGLSIGSLAIGFAARDSIENLFGTFTVLLDKPFQLGDFVTLGDVQGTVELVGFRSTRVRTAIDSLITVPNRRFISDSVENYGARRARRLEQVFGFSYESSLARLEAFCEGAREWVRHHPATDKERYFVYFSALTANSLDVSFVCYLNAPDIATEQRERHRMLADMMRLAQKLELSFAFPTQTVQWIETQAPVRPSGPPHDELDARSAGRELGAQLAREAMGGAGPGGLPASSFADRDSLSPASGRSGMQARSAGGAARGAGEPPPS